MSVFVFIMMYVRVCQRERSHIYYYPSSSLFYNYVTIFFFVMPTGQGVIFHSHATARNFARETKFYLRPLIPPLLLLL